MAECLTVNQNVPGSSPGVGAKFKEFIMCDCGKEYVTIEIDISDDVAAFIERLAARTGLDVDTLIEHAIIEYIISSTK